MIQLPPFHECLRVICACGKVLRRCACTDPRATALQPGPCRCAPDATAAQPSLTPAAPAVDDGTINAALARLMGWQVLTAPPTGARTVTCTTAGPAEESWFDPKTGELFRDPTDDLEAACAVLLALARDHDLEVHLRAASAALAGGQVAGWCALEVPTKPGGPGLTLHARPSRAAAVGAYEAARIAGLLVGTPSPPTDTF